MFGSVNKTYDIKILESKEKVCPHKSTRATQNCWNCLIYC